MAKHLPTKAPRLKDFRFALEDGLATRLADLIRSEFQDILDESLQESVGDALMETARAAGAFVEIDAFIGRPSGDVQIVVDVVALDPNHEDAATHYKASLRDLIVELVGEDEDLREWAASALRKIAEEIESASSTESRTRGRA